MKCLYQGESIKVEQQGNKVLVHVNFRLPGFLPYELKLSMTPAGFNRFKTELNKCEYLETKPGDPYYEVQQTLP